MMSPVLLLLATIALVVPSRALAHALPGGSPLSSSLPRPPEEHEEWEGKIQALWMSYPITCDVWGSDPRSFLCTANDNVLLAALHQENKTLRLNGRVLNEDINVLFFKKGNTFLMKGEQGGTPITEGITVEGTLAQFTVHWTHGEYPLEFQGTYGESAVSVSGRLLKPFPIDATFTLARLPPLEPTLPLSGTSSAILTESGTTTPTLSAENIRESAENIANGIVQKGEGVTRVSRVITLVLQGIFGILALLTLVAFGILVSRMRHHPPQPPPPPTIHHTPGMHGGEQ